MLTFWKFIETGGWFMAPLGVCSVISVAIMLERAIALRRGNVIKASLEQAIHDLRHGGKTTLLEQLSADEKTALDRLVRSCLRYLPWSKFENAEALQTKARGEVSILERGLVILEIVVGIAPLLGLLGTISGLITIFAAVGTAGNITSQGLLIAKGISEALHSTVAGLVVAIPSLIAHSIYIRRVDRFSVELEDLSVDLLGKLYTEPETAEGSIASEARR